MNRVARKQPFNPDVVKKLRKEFLLLMKNAKVVKTPRQAYQWKSYMRTWRENFSEMLDRVADAIKDLPLQHVTVSRDEATKWERDFRKETWGLYINSQVPIDRADDYYDEDARFYQFQKELKKWEGRVRREARKAWKALEDTVSRYRYYSHGQDPVIDAPSEEQARIDGFQVLIKDYHGSSLQQESFERFKEGLKLYKQRAKQTLPLLLQLQLPLVLDFRSGLDEGGSYHQGRYIKINPHAVQKNPGRMAQILAHEMGHHLYQKYLTKAQNNFWHRAITGNYGDLDLRTVLSKYGSERSLFDNERIKREDPLLYLQIQGLYIENSVFDRKSIFSMDDLREYLADGGQAVWRVHGKPITGYAHKNPEEAFCEALGMLVGYGPRTVLPEVRSWLKTILPNLKIARRVAARYLALKGW